MSSVVTASVPTDDFPSSSGAAEYKSSQLLKLVTRWVNTEKLRRKDVVQKSEKYRHALKIFTKKLSSRQDNLQFNISSIQKIALGVLKT